MQGFEPFEGTVGRTLADSVPWWPTPPHPVDGDKKFLRDVPGTKGQVHTTIEGGLHFVQEDKGPELAQVVNKLLGAG